MTLSSDNNHESNHPILLSNEQKQLGKDLYRLYLEIISEAEKIKNYYKENNPNLQYENWSADNLICYLSLRKKNIEDLQLRLAEDGLSSLGRLENHVLVNFEQILKHFGQLKKISYDDAQLTIFNRSTLLLGRPRKSRTTRIMVTIDIDFAYQPLLLEQLLINGMDIARINCAYDTEKDWKVIINSIRKAEERLIQKGQEIERKCRIVMDLNGPKIRIEPMRLASMPLKISVPKDIYGKTVKLVEGFLDCEAKYTEKINLVGVHPSFIIAISNRKNELTHLKVGERLVLHDSRGRYRTITVLENISRSRIRIGIDKTLYLQEGLTLQREKNNSTYFHLENADKNLSPYSFNEVLDELVIGPIRPHPIELELKLGDRLLLYKKYMEGHPATKDRPAGISCSMPEVLNKIQINHKVFIDDGKIASIVKSINDEYIELEITYPESTTAKIRSDKGLNFPDSNLGISAITSRDIENLKFIVKHASAVGMSFTNDPEDIRSLYKEILNLGYPDFGIIAKIETHNAIHNLARIILTGLTIPKFGILIARGDLAIEIGFENLSLIQEDILCLCEAAHVPVILATQILETLAKSGLPTRAEITDAARGQRAECVMLNKGKYITEAVKILSTLLKTEQRHNIKKRQIFREFTWQNEVFDI
jgi:pyruvate kinase